MGLFMSVAKKVTRFAAFSARRRERLARSVHVFLVGVIIACGIEVAVDWHATLGEVRALRTRVKERGQNYAAVLVRPLAPAVARRDVPEIARLTSGVFEDQDVVFVRVVGPDKRRSTRASTRASARGSSRPASARSTTTTPTSSSATPRASSKTPMASARAWKGAVTTTSRRATRIS